MKRRDGKTFCQGYLSAVKHAKIDTDEAFEIIDDENYKEDQIDWVEELENAQEDQGTDDTKEKRDREGSQTEDEYV